MKSKLTWKDIEERRNLLLAQTNWIQSPHNGLTEESSAEWKRWRTELTSVNKNNFELAAASRHLDKLKQSSPNYEYKDHKDFFEGGNTEFLDIPDIVKMIKDLVVENLGEPEENTETENLLLDDFNDLEEAKKYVRRELDKSCRNQIGRASPAPEVSQLYLERLNQAIDFLSGMGTSFPLLQVWVDNSNKSMQEVAEKVVSNHSNMIATFVNIEDRYFKTLKAVKESDTIAQLRQVSEKFINGH